MTQIMLQQGGKHLMLQFLDLPKALDIENAALVKTTLDGSRNALLKLFKGSKVILDKDFQVNKKYPARDLALEIPDVGIYRVRIILTGPKLYQIILFGPKGYQDSPEAKKFIGSFKLKG
jgi:hypothetical protein